MGIYIKNDSDVIIKIGKVDEAFFSRSTLLQFMEQGFRGFEHGEYNNYLSEVLEDKNTLYLYEKDPMYMEYMLNKKTFFLPAEDIAHDPVELYHNSFYYKVKCKQQGEGIIQAKLIGEKIIDGKMTSIFQCACCNKLFTIDHLTAMFLRNLIPNCKSYFNSKYDSELEDLDLVETLEVMIDTYTPKEINILLRNGSLKRICSYIQSKGYRNIEEIYNKYQEIKAFSQKLAKEIGKSE